MKNKLTNIQFWFAVIALFLASARIDVESLTSWVILKEQLILFIQNPFLIGTFIVALSGIFEDNSVKGFDLLKKK